MEEGFEVKGNEPGVLPEAIALVVMVVVGILFGIIRERTNVGTPPPLYDEENAEYTRSIPMQQIKTECVWAAGHETHLSSYGYKCAAFALLLESTKPVAVGSRSGCMFAIAGGLPSLFCRAMTQCRRFYKVPDEWACHINY